MQARGAGEQAAAAAEQEGWVICRVFKKKNLVVHHGQSGAAATSKAAAAGVESSPRSNCSSVVTVSDHAKAAVLLHSAASGDDDALDHILQYMGGSHRQETKPAAAVLDHHHHQHHLAAAAACPAGAGLYGKFMKLPPLEHVHAGGGLQVPSPGEYASGIAADWDALDRLAASYELNGGLPDSSAPNKTTAMAAFFDEPGSAPALGDGDLWSLARSVSSSLLHHAADLTTTNNV